MESNGGNSNLHSPQTGSLLPPRSARKRNATQAEVNADQMLSLSDEIIIEAAVAVVFLMMNSSQLQISLLLKSLHKNDLDDFNDAISSVISNNIQQNPSVPQANQHP